MGGKKNHHYYTDECKKFVFDHIKKGSSARKATREMCLHFKLECNENVERAYRQLVEKENLSKKFPNLEESLEFKKAKKRIFDNSKKYFLITWAQAETDIHEGLFKNMKAYAETIDAGIHVIAGRYKSPISLEASKAQQKREKSKNFWDSRLEPYLDANRQNLHTHLSLLADVKVQPTASTPLSGFNSITALESCIIGHPRVHLKSLPTLDGYPHKLLLTTGAITVPNYSDTKVGKKGEFHHTLGFVIVELDGDIFHIRQIQCEEDGSFYDLNFKISNGEVTTYKEKCPVIVFGDLHLGQEDNGAVGCAFQLVSKLLPSVIVVHDVFDGYSISHHEQKDPFLLGQRELDGTWNLESELNYMYEWFNDRKNYEFLSVMSNHNDFLDRFLKNSDWRKSTNRAKYLELANIVMQGHAPKGIIPYLLDANTENVTSIGYNDSYRVFGWELGLHGDFGNAGSRGSVIQFKNLNTKSVTGHCLPSDYLVQTKNSGWKEIRAIKVGEEVLSYDSKTNTNIWTTVLQTIENDYQGVMLRIQGQGFEQTFTSNHHLMLKDGTYLPASEAIISRSASELPISANPVESVGCSVPELVIRRLVAICADGSQDGYRVRFHLKKQRKIDRLKLLFGEDLKEYNSKDGSYDAVISTRSDTYSELMKYKPNIYQIKTLSYEVLEWDTPSLEILEDELRYWDGTYNPKGNSRQYSTTNVNTANIVSSVLNRLGYSNSTTKKKKTADNHKTVYTITWCKNREYIKTNKLKRHDKRFGSWGFWSYQANCKVYCLSVETKCFWVKSPSTGQVSLTGNSHSPQREDGSIVAGTLTKLRLGYNKGLSSWMQGVVVMYPNGKCSHIHFINNRFTTFYGIFFKQH